MSDKKTVAEVLAEVRFAERLEELQLKLPATLVLAKEGATLAKKNQVRRKFYRESELLRIEIEEKLNEYGIESEWLSSAEIAEANRQLDAIRKQLRLEVISTADSQFDKVYTAIRFATFLLVFIGWFGAACVLIPLRLLDQTLREAGVKKNYLPLDIVSSFMAKVLCITGASDATAEGREHLTNLDDAVVCMFSHASNLDGFIVNARSPVAFKYAAKKSLFMLPFLGWVARWGFRFVPIDRSNRKNALASLKYLAQLINVEGASVCISPEGTRSKDGLLQEFKKGPFYLRDDTKKNVIPAIVFGAYECWPPERYFSTPGRTLVRFLPQFAPDPAKNRNQNRLALRRIFLDAFVQDVPDDIGTASNINALLYNMLQIYLIWAFSLKVIGIGFSIADWTCYLLGISYWTYAQLGFLITLGLEIYMFFTC